MKKDTNVKAANATDKQTGDGYPVYPSSEDIYKKSKLEDDIDPEDISKTKEPVHANKADQPNELDFKYDKSGKDLDIPGSELDDEDEAIGSEDEENNAYSLGGDNHNDLEEEKE